MSDRAAGVPDQSTPEAVAGSLRAAMRARDWRSALTCILPEHRARLVAATYYGAAHIPSGDEAAGRELAALIERHGLQAERVEAFELDALVVMLDDIMRWSARFLAPEKALDLAERAARTTYSEFQTAGEYVYAIATCDGRRSQTRFVQRDGRWYVD